MRLRKLDEEGAINIISTTFTSHDNSTSIGYKPIQNFNPIDKIVQLNDEKIALYERMLRDKELMIEELKKLSGNGSK